VCGSDLWPYRGLNPITEPTPMGHEYCGIVERTGSAVTSVKPGQFVIGSFLASDNTCSTCQAGYQSSCRHRRSETRQYSRGRQWRSGRPSGRAVRKADLRRPRDSIAFNLLLHPLLLFPVSASLDQLHHHVARQDDLTNVRQPLHRGWAPTEGIDKYVRMTKTMGRRQGIHEGASVKTGPIPLASGDVPCGAAHRQPGPAPASSQKGSPDCR
jgi:hypothetical protein